MITTESTLAVMARIVKERGWIAPSVTHEILALPTWWLPGAATPVTLHGALELALRELHGADALPLEAYGLQWAMPCCARAAGEPLALWECTPKRRKDEVISLLDAALAVANGRGVPGVPRMKHSPGLRDAKSRLTIYPLDGRVLFDGLEIGTIARETAQTMKRGFSAATTYYQVLVTVEGEEIDLAAPDLASAQHWLGVKITGILRDAMARRGVK